MKRVIIIFLAVALHGCGIMECEQVALSEVTVLVDISDPKLLAAARQDFDRNLPAFMKSIGLTQTGECHQLKFNIAPLSGRDELRMDSDIMGIDKKGLSKREAAKLSSPRPIINMLQRNMEEFERLKNEKDYNSGSSIGNQILKAIKQMEATRKSVLVVVTDGISNDGRFSMYKTIPERVTPEVMNLVFDPRLMEEFEKGTGRKGVIPSVILVHLQAVEDGMKNKRREIAAFWNEVLSENLELDVTIVDNLSN